MKKTLFVFLNLILIFAAAIGAVAAQNLFEGYALDVDATNAGACAIRFLPNRNELNHIQVFVAGTDMQRPATGITACDNSRVQGSRVAPSGFNQKWCFQGPDEKYEIKLSNGSSYIWPAADRNLGFYNVKDFRPMKRVDGPTVSYTYSEPADYTKAIRNAMMVMASRQGGTLQFPDGDYIVGTTDGNTRDPAYQAITVPSGVTIQGASGNYSVPGGDLPNRKSATRIRLRNNKQAIFRIGGCTNSVSVRNIELLGNSALLGETRRDRAGTYGVEALGEWSVDPVSKAQSANQSQFFKFENVVFQDFDTGIILHNTNEANCNAARQMCNSWQFDNILVDHGIFMNNGIGISIDTFNTDWIISNSQFNYMEAIAPGYGIRVKKAASVLVENSFGGGYDYGPSIGGTFIHIDSVGTMTLVSASSERSRKSISATGYGAVSSQSLTVIGSVFNDPIELTGKMNYASFGNRYFGYTMSVGPTVIVNSVGDKFCYDAVTYPGHCTDKVGGGNIVNSPGFNGGTIMFRSGRLPEGQGKDRINREPNLFGYDVEINKGLLQHDPNMTLRDINALAAPVETGSRVKDGAIVYCKDCKKAANGVCTQGRAGTDGAFAKRINNQWRCD